MLIITAYIIDHNQPGLFDIKWPEGGKRAPAIINLEPDRER